MAGYMTSITIESNKGDGSADSLFEVTVLNLTRLPL